MKFNLLYKAFSVGVLLSILNACEVTDVDPADRIPESQAYTSASSVNSAVIGVYEAAQRGYYAGAVDRGYPFGAASTEQGDMRGEDMYNDQLFYEVTYIGGWNITTANNNGMWIGLFRLINRINVTLAGIDEAKTKGIITDVVANDYKAELLFMRALSYHELLVHFCRPYSDDPSLPGMPYRVTPIDGVDDISRGIADSNRGTIAETYTKLLQDLDDAESLFSVKNKRGSSTYRASWGAVIALKTRVKLHMEDWEGVLEEYDKIASVYTLQESAETPFTTWTSAENVFSLQNSTASNPGTNGALANMYGSPGLNGRGLVKVSPLIWKASFWLPNDTRRTLLTVSHSTGIYSNKYRRIGTNEDAVPLIRFAEVILNAAEANARQEEYPTAITLLNEVRGRAVPAGTPDYDLASLGNSQAGVLEGIWNERRIEFLAEGRRWADIHRLSGSGDLAGVPLKAQSRSVSSTDFYNGTKTVVTDHAIPYSSHLFIWPIPIEEVLNNPVLAEQQNPGYN